LYLALFICWAVLATAWYVLTDIVYHAESLTLSKAMVAVPALRTLVTVVSFIFWVECDNFAGMCKTSSASALSMLYPLVEAGDTNLRGDMLRH
jgi:hypothetical protein